jgi:hypothetical protein
MKIPEPQNSLTAKIDAAVEAEANNAPRPHLGASLIGHKCDRWLWLSFRWAVQPTFPGRILRLFRRGHDEESKIIRLLQKVGLGISGSQTRVNLGGHVSGSMDGIVTAGVPEAPKKRHVLEIKTHNKKSFDDLEKHQVEKSKPQHWAQMQTYMLGSNIDRALYVALCKDDERLYTERIKLDPEAAQALVDRAQRITISDRMPEPLSADPTWFECKLCDAHEFCHKTRLTKHVNCRTCAHVSALEDGSWHCAKHQAGGIPTDFQRAGCEHHVLHPDLVPWKMLDSSSPWEAVYEIRGQAIRNGEADGNVYASGELVEAGEAILDETVQAVRKTFENAQVVKGDGVPC